MKLIQLDGTDGGGQMLRTALSLAMVTGQPFRMTSIRGKRPKPGLMRQHLTCVKAACEISNGTADGAEIGSTELVFRAGKTCGGDYRFSIGTAGSTSLLFQTLLPALLHAGGASTLRLEGGTHNPLAPPFEFIDRVFLPALGKMGGRATVSLVQSGFAPVGGGIIEATIQPCEKLAAFHLHEPGEVKSLVLRVPSRNLPIHIAGRILDSALAQYPCDDASVEIREPGPGRGVCCLYEAVFEHTSELTSAFGETNVTAERVGRRAAKTIQDFIGSGAAVGRCLADQLLLPMALAGEGSFTTMAPDDHIPTNISVIEKFLPVRFSIETADRGKRVISVR
ncbi:RNA 3'-terminal phosphate cyclase [Luteolibacter yonseiensis]|uniref:RNA 3'-terminal phosphate cyclase n=1 Tax=Luteolibacter yonseiensis TaxID=1144680 RepID=A0A934R380_9BACT|nr:RNA 3'-terminal phosphate cyclase [Luteolibacter yonseiensis]MBK1815476.1 RNA 3'-terminal phosphate cyclase [Luteolibacter yonseiensis]